jgi:cation:H+ antiporter
LSILDLFLFLAGLGLLVMGAELLVRGSTRLGELAGLSPLVVGLTIVSFATTAPEATVSITAASSGRGELALGNVLGSNIFNMLVVVGAAALITALPVTSITVRKDVPVLIIATAVVLLFAINGTVAKWEAVLMLLALVAFISFSVWQSRRDSHPTAGSMIRRTRRAAMREISLGSTLGLGGAVLLVFGSRLFVDSASTIAAELGVSELIVGLTVAAVGTSAPELTTSIVAAVKGQTDVAVGNAIGASIINLLGIVALSSLVSPGGLAVPNNAIQLDFPVALSVAVMALPMAMIGMRIVRWKGAFMITYYGVYVAVLIIDSVSDGLVEKFSVVMLAVVLPATVAAAAYGVFRANRRYRRLRARSSEA